MAFTIAMRLKNEIGWATVRESSAELFDPNVGIRQSRRWPSGEDTGRSMTTHIQETTDPRSAITSIAADFFGPAIADAPIVCPPTDVPPPFDGLLVHEEHMTTRLAAHHGEPVMLEVMEDRQMGDTYQRKILLTVGDGHVVEVGVARIHLNFTADDVRAEILSKKSPLGDILINHNVLRRIEPKWFLRFEGPPALLAAFDRPLKGPAYGRIGVIHCDGAPAIELLEVVAADRTG